VAWKDVKSTYFSILSEEGFRPEFDSDDDIHFRYEGGHYYVTSDSDEGYFCLLFPRFWRIESKEELFAALVAANSVNRRVKVARVVLATDGSNTSVTAECFFTSRSDARSFIVRSLRLIKRAVELFAEDMRDLR